MVKHEEHRLCLGFIKACNDFPMKYQELSLKHKGQVLSDKVKAEIKEIRKIYLPDSWDENGLYVPNDNEPRVECSLFHSNRR